MSHVPSSHLHQPVAQSAPDRPTRPGWPEIAVGLVAMAVIALGGGRLIGQLGFEPGVYGLILAGWAGIAGIAAFAAAVMVRIRSLDVFGVRRTTARWLLIGAGTGVAATLVKILVTIVWIQLTGDDATSDTPQTVYAEGASGGLLSLVLATVLLGLLTPLGEELLFRGVLTNALLRYGPVIGVGGSALVFALMHGVNIIFPAALVAGLFAGEVFRRSGSVWPAVLVHVVFNLPTPLAMVAAGMG